jgi:hypothetical protein
MSGHKPSLPPRLKEIFEELDSNIARTKAVTYAEMYDAESGRVMHGYVEGHDLRTSQYLDRIVNDMIAVQTAIGMNNPGLAMNALMGCRIDGKSYPSICGYYDNISNLRKSVLSEIQGLPVMPQTYFRQLKSDISPFVR